MGGGYEALLPRGVEKPSTWESCKRAWIVLKECSTSPRAKGSWLWTKFFVRLVILVLCVAVQVYISYPVSEFTTALHEADRDKFYHGVKKFMIIAMFCAPLFAFDSYMGSYIALTWRQIITQDYLKTYFSDRSFYYLARDQSIDNPGQRIMDDSYSFVSTIQGLIELVVDHICSLVGYTYVLFHINAHFLPMLIAYTMCGTLFTVCTFGNKLRDFQAMLLRQGASVRAYLVRVRHNSESIALFNASKFEAETVDKSFLELLDTHWIRVWWIMGLHVFKNFYKYVTICVPYLMLAEPFFRGEIKFGQITQASLAFRHLLSALNVIINQISTLTSLAATTERLWAVRVAMIEVQEKDLKPKLDEDESSPLSPKAYRDGFSETVSYHETDSDRFAVEKLSYMPPVLAHGEHPYLVEGLTADLSESNLLIVGPSGIGKSSLFRVISGLWTAGTGSVTKPYSGVLFVPQNAYLPIIKNNSLRGQMMFPTLEEDLGTSDYAGHMSDESLVTLLIKVRLEHLLRTVSPTSKGSKGINRIDDWDNILSTGEKQRLSFARIFTNKPKYALLDECTSALDVDNERNLYTMLKNSDTKYISIGHRPTLMEYHDRVLLIRGGGDYELMDPKQYREHLVMEAKAQVTVVDGSGLRNRKKGGSRAGQGEAGGKSTFV